MDKYGTALPFDKVMSMNTTSTSSSSSALGWLFGGSSGRTSSSSSSSSSQQQQQQQLPGAFAAAGAEGAELFAASAMRCGGCGAKVGSSTLRRVLKRIKAQQRQHQQQQQQQGLASAASSAAAAAGDALLQQVQLGADDAAVLSPPPPGHLLVSTIDFFRAFWPDAYLLGKIAANHALGVGRRPQHCYSTVSHEYISSVLLVDMKADCMYSCTTMGHAGCMCVRIHHTAYSIQHHACLQMKAVHCIPGAVPAPHRLCVLCAVLHSDLRQVRQHQLCMLLCRTRNELSGMATPACDCCLQDCYAMGATPSSALALAVVPYGPNQFQEAELGDLLEGAVQVGGKLTG
jgi:hypothetical protein